MAPAASPRRSPPVRNPAAAPPHLRRMEMKSATSPPHAPPLLRPRKVAQSLQNELPAQDPDPNPHPALNPDPNPDLGLDLPPRTRSSLSHIMNRCSKGGFSLFKHLVSFNIPVFHLVETMVTLNIKASSLGVLYACMSRLQLKDSELSSVLCK